MGLLEKAKQKKQALDVPDIIIKTELKDEDLKEQVMSLDLQGESKHDAEKLSVENGFTKTNILKKVGDQKSEGVHSKFKDYETKQKEIIDERKGFGWKGLGSRRIVYHPDISEYIYEVSEPVLNDFEKETKKELSYLFKMLADVNISSIEKEKKEKYLEETLEKIIEDNDIKFHFEGDEESPKKSIKELLHIKSKNNDNTSVVKSNENELQNKTRSLYKKDEVKEAKKKKTNDELEDEKRLMNIATNRIKDNIFYHLFGEFLGYGKIDILMNDEGIEDISCDGPDTPIFLYHKKYEEVSTNIFFENTEELDSFVVRLSQICGKQISIYSPIVDGKLPDGSRLQTTLAKTVTKGSTFTIRRFRENPLTPIDLIKFKSISIDMAAYFWMAIERGGSILFCGGTASGKTTALNALSLFIPPAYKIISIEDTREVSLPHKNWIAGTTRQGFSSSDDNKTGKDIDMFDLIRAALRQRPKVIIVGEVRGKEAYSLFQAMATGHTSYATVHASTIHTLIQRLESPPISLPRALLTSLDIILFQNATEIDGRSARRVTSVTEIIKLDPDTNQLIFMEPFRWVSKTDDRFESSGSSKILNNIRLQNDWDEKQLINELKNRRTILQWMLDKNITDYKDVGDIVSEYYKHPNALLKRAHKEMEK